MRKVTEKLKGSLGRAFRFAEKLVRVRDICFAVLLVILALAVLFGGFWAHFVVATILILRALKIAFSVSL